MSRRDELYKIATEWVRAKTNWPSDQVIIDEVVAILKSIPHNPAIDSLIQSKQVFLIVLPINPKRRSEVELSISLILPPEWFYKAPQEVLDTIHDTIARKLGLEHDQVKLKFLK